jgi:hypothetical protein
VVTNHIITKLSITVELIKDVQIEKVFREWRNLNKSRILTCILIFFLFLQVTWGILYFHNNLSNFSTQIVRVFWFFTAIGGIIIGLINSKKQNKLLLAAITIIISIIMIGLWLLGYLITRM